MKRNVVLIVSIAFGILAAVLTRLYISACEAEVTKQKETMLRRYGEIDVLCFGHDTPGGTVLDKSDLKVRAVPAVGMRGQALQPSDLDVVLQKKTLIAHRKGEVLFWSDIEGGNPGVRGLAYDVRKQMRAVSISCNTASSVSGMVRPNDHVDVIATFNFPDPETGMSKGDPVTCTILQNVLVLATGSETAKSRVSEMGVVKPSGYSTVTLEVTPREAEMLAFAEQIRGRLVLTLRNNADTSYEKELPKVDFEKIRTEIEELNLKRQQRLGGR